jgi:hypothetical protein
MKKIPPGVPTIYHPVSFYPDGHDDAEGEEEDGDDMTGEPMMEEPKPEPEPE